MTLRRRCAQWREDRRGSFSMHFALALVPLLGIAGGALDYSYSGTVKLKLDAAADAAALVAVGRSTLYTDTTSAEASAQASFNGQVTGIKRTVISSLKVAVTDNGLSRSATVSYTAYVPTTLLQIIGIKTITMSGSAGASFARAPYIDFYVLLDNTPSMGVGATNADITKMVNNTSDKCAFACHDLSNANSYYNLAKKLGVTMRIDVLRTATQQLMDTAASTADVSNQFRMAVYTFGAKAEAMGLTSVVPLTGDLASARSQASAVDLMTVPNNSYNNDMDTPFDKVINAMATAIPAAGVGSNATSPQKVLFLVSDGVADQNKTTGCSQPLSGSRCQEPFNPTLCTTLKSRGVKIAVLYTTYLPLPTNSWYNTWLKPFASSIPTNMQQCASPGLYFEVSPSGGIADAMTALFKQAILSARLTQ
jgi:Flp pilus assembly protein TadG